MGVDYTAHYGIGFEVDIPAQGSVEAERIKTGDYQETPIGVWHDLNDYLDEQLADSDYLVFSVGKGAYTGAVDPLYVVIAKPFNEVAKDLRGEQDKLVNYLKSIGVNTKGEFDLHGGLQIW